MRRVAVVGIDVAEGRSNKEEYEAANNVEEKPVDDIVNRIKQKPVK